MLGTGFKPGVRHAMPQVGSTPTSFRQITYFRFNGLQDWGVFRVKK